VPTNVAGHSLKLGAEPTGSLFILADQVQVVAVVVAFAVGRGGAVLAWCDSAGAPVLARVVQRLQVLERASALLVQAGRHGWCLAGHEMALCHGMSSPGVG
jgi:hypothetical protein